MSLRIVALDDYQGLVEQMGLGERLAGELEGAGLDGELAEFELVAVREHLAGDALTAALAGAQVVVAMRERTRFDRALLSALPDLRLLVTTGMRNAAIDLAAADEQGVTVSGTEGPPSANTAELTWGLILSVLRHIPEEHAAMAAGGWQRTVGRDLLGARLGLVGLGRIGHQMARIAAAFEMDVVAWSQHLDPEVAAAAGVLAVTKEELFATSDVVSVHLVLSDRSRGLIGEPELRLMQPNLKQDVKFNYAARHDVMNRYVELSSHSTDRDSPGMKDVTHLIWPESAFPFFLTREADALAQITQLLPPGAVLITGAVRASEPVNPAARQAFNSIYVIDHSGSILASYDKVHLVPFGEYLPFKPLLEALGMQTVTKQIGGFQPGDRRRLLAIPGTSLALPLICYEIIFPGDVVPPGERPGWIVNVTNDGWFGISAGPYQHFQQARVRAIEEGLPLVRAANTGISAVVDPVGRVVNSLRLGEEGVLDSPLPRSIRAPLYARVGDAPAALMVVIALVVVVRRRFRA